MQKFFAILAILFVNGAMAMPLRSRQARFITSPCTSDAGCDTGCCGFKSGTCAGPVIALERDNGCGFGNAQSNNNAALAIGSNHAFTPTLASGGAATGAEAVDDVDNAAAGDDNDNGAAVAPGSQLITSPCTSDADCGSGCCGFKSGTCAGAVIALERDNGCGFGNAQSNNNAALAIGSNHAFTPTLASGGAAASGAEAADDVDNAAADNTNGVAVAPGSQLITSPCTSDADCGSGCCGFKSGTCAGAVIALERDNGCGFGDAQSNNNAALAIGSTHAFTPTSARK